MAIWLAMVGLVIASVGAGGYFFYTNGLQYGLKSQMNLAKDGPLFPKYSKPDFMSSSSLYLYQIENPREALKGKNIKVKKIGPYVFDVENSKDDAFFSDDEQLVTFTAHTKFYFRQDKSARLDERIYMLNPIVPVTYNAIKKSLVDKLPFKGYSSMLVYQAINAILDSHNERLFYKKTPRKVIFGYKLEILESVQEVAKRFGLASIVPKELPADNMFGLMLFRNGTSDQFTLHTGLGDHWERFGDVIKWRGQKTVSFWKAPCNKIEGTNGELNKPFPQSNKSIQVFISAICRTISLDPVRMLNLDQGMEVIEFEMSKKAFQGYRSNPANKCFCENIKNRECRYDGLMTLGPCKYNLPAFVSKANYKNVDPILKRSVEGVDENEQPTLDRLLIDPVTGAIVEANVAYMASLKLQRNEALKELKNLKNVTFVPYMVIHEEVSLPGRFLNILTGLQMITENHGIIFLVMGSTGATITLLGLLIGGKSKTSETNRSETSSMSIINQTSTDGESNSYFPASPSPSTKRLHLEPAGEH